MNVEEIKQAVCAVTLHKTLRDALSELRKHVTVVNTCLEDDDLVSVFVETEVTNYHVMVREAAGGGWFMESIE